MPDALKISKNVNPRRDGPRCLPRLDLPFIVERTRQSPGCRGRTQESVESLLKDE